MLEFHFIVIELAKMTPDDFRQLGLPGIQPFMILTMGGATREVADEIFNNLKEAGREETLPAAFTLVSLAFGKGNIADQQWLRERFRMHNVLRETPIYQEMTKEAREEGLQQACNKAYSRVYNRASCRA